MKQLKKSWCLLLVPFLSMNCNSFVAVKDNEVVKKAGNTHLLFDFRNISEGAGWRGFSNEFYLNDESISWDFNWKGKLRPLIIPSDPKNKVTFKIRNYVTIPFDGMKIRSTQSETLTGLESRFLEKLNIDFDTINTCSVAIVKLKITKNTLSNHYLETITDIFLFPVRWAIGQFPSSFQRIGYDIHYENSKLGGKVSERSQIGKIVDVTDNKEIIIQMDRRVLDLDSVYLLDNDSVTYGKIVLIEQNGNTVKGVLACVANGYSVHIGDKLNINSKTNKISN